MKIESVKLTGTTLPVIVLCVAENSSDMLFDQLTNKVSQSAQFFQHSPIVIDLGGIPLGRVLFNVSRLVEHCRSLGLQPIAFRNVHESMKAQAIELPTLPYVGKENTTELRVKESDDAQVNSAESDLGSSEQINKRASKLITRPIRSGQQVYAEGTDLIVLAQVSEGSEVIADGNIHIYGALRGRALAGVKGDISARIFCQHMNAELIAIAGNFLLSDSIDEALTNQAVHISLEGDRLIVNRMK